MNEKQLSEQAEMIKSLYGHTGYNPIVTDDGDLILKPDMLGKSFFTKLLCALENSSYIFTVNRSLEVVLFKP